MTALFYDNDTKTLYTDSFVLVNGQISVDNVYFKEIVVEPQFQHRPFGASTTFEEKVYKDPRNCFYVAALGIQPWVGKKKQTFDALVVGMLAAISAFEYGDCEPIKEFNRPIEDENQEESEDTPNVYVDPIEFEKNFGNSRPITEKEKYERLKSSISFLFVTKKHCYVFTRGQLLVATDHVYLGVGSIMFKDLVYLGYSHKKAFETVVENDSSAGGQIHAYESSELKEI